MAGHVRTAVEELRSVQLSGTLMLRGGLHNE
mgnify:CR=1 FL=1